MITNLIANARMYSVAPGAVAAWKRLFVWLEAKSGIGLTVIDHAYPAPLDALWGREDLACTFMCGWPHLRRGGKNPMVAAPIPSAAYAKGKAVYCSHFVARKDSGLNSVADCLGKRMGYTIHDSHSGYNAPRHHLLRYRKGDAPLFAEAIGPLMTPRLVLEALNQGKIDVGPLDSFAFALLDRHAPELTRDLKIIESTDTVPIPAFVAAPGADPAIVERLAAALVSLTDDPAQKDLMAELCILGFARATPDAYRITEDWAQEAEKAGYAVIA